MFVPGGIKPGKNSVDKLEEREIPYHISNWRLKEIGNIEALIKEIGKGEIRFAFLDTAAMGGLLHVITSEDPSEFFGRANQRVQRKSPPFVRKRGIVIAWYISSHYSNVPHGDQEG